MISLKIIAEYPQKTAWISTVKVCPNSGVTVDLITEELAKKVGCRMKKNSIPYNYPKSCAGPSIDRYKHLSFFQSQPI